ncbi:MAG: 4Fe-4S dicluster domain-containing protein [bacterium]|nr:4Fe-4S dicluster domain-containing protein [bacterium]
MDKSRRKFLSTAAVATASASMLATTGQASERLEHNQEELFSVLVDSTACIGCRKCEYACNKTHELNDNPLSFFEDRSVLQERRRPEHDAFTVVNAYKDARAKEGEAYVKVQCMHCNDPACVSACLVGALSKDRHGPVLYDAWKCIGCRYCMVSCPFQVPAYEYQDAVAPRVRKCNFCTERIHNGERPACVEICPNEALMFGTRKEMLDVAYGRMSANPDKYDKHVYGEHEVGGTSWIYLTHAGFQAAGFPVLDVQSPAEITENIQHGIFKSFLPPLALYGLLGLIMHASGQKEDSEDSKNA